MARPGILRQGDEREPRGFPSLSRSALAVIAALFLWGWAEATCFFIVPDVALTFTVLLGWRCALGSLAAAVGGALAGAVTIYALPPDAFSHLWLALPGFYPSMSAVARGHLEHGASGLLAGPIEGIPFRVFVAEAHRIGLPLGSVLLWTPIARLPRMLIAPLCAGLFYAVLRWQRESLDLRYPLRAVLVVVYLSIWTAIYYHYWHIYLPGRFGVTSIS